MSSNTLTDLQIVSPTVKAASGEMRRKYQYALDMGVLDCHTAKVMFLGDKGTGKSSTKNLLLGRELSYSSGAQEVIKTHVTETKVMTENWKELTEDSLTEYRGSEFSRAVAYFCAFAQVNYLDLREERFGRIAGIAIFLTLVLSLCIGGSWFLVASSMDYTSLLICCALGIAFSGRNFVNGFNIGNGLASVLVFAYFFVTHTAQTLQQVTLATRLVALGLLGGIGGYIGGTLLAVGFGPGISMSLCLLRNAEQLTMAALPGLALFSLGVLLAMFCESQSVRRQHALLNWAVTPLCFILSVLLIHAAVRRFVPVTPYVAGFLFGLFFISGQKWGRKMAWRLSLGHKNRLVTDLIGMIVGFVFAFNLMEWQLPKDDNRLISGAVGVLFCVAAELYRFYVSVTDEMPVRAISRMMRDGDDKWPMKLNILDCKSSNVYDNVHHIFMSRYCIYLVVFRLDHLRDNFDATYERILFWLNSVFAHAPHHDAKVFLIATHKAAIRDETARTELLNRLSCEVYRPFGARLMNNSRNESFVFAVDNVFRDINDTDVTDLKEIVFQTAMGAHYTTSHNRVTWFRFLDIIRERKKSLLQNPKYGIIKCNDLWFEVKEPCHLNVQTDFYRMLKYFHDCGEIYYDDADPVLCRYVVLNPQYLINAVDFLLKHSYVLERHGRLRMLKEDLSKDGIINHIALTHCIKPMLDDEEVLIRLLVSLNVLLPVDGRFCSNYTRYVVPFLLPTSPDESKLVRTPDCIAAFDFKSFYPEPVFLHLLTQSLALSFRTTQEYGVVVSEKNLRFYKDQGSFFFGNAIHFSIHLYKPQSHTNQIWVRAKALESSIGDRALEKGDLYEFLHQLDVLMRRICWRHFEFLEYEYKVLCDCCLDRCANMNGVPEVLEWHTVVDYSHGSPANVSTFPSRDQFYICQEGKKIYFKGNPKPIDEKLLKDPSFIRDVAHDFTIDAFVSSCAEDRIFVLQDLLPILENASTKSFGNEDDEAECLCLVVNEYDNPSPDYRSNYSPFMMNVLRMKSTHCIIAVISREYRHSVRCKKELEIALKMEKPIIPVMIDNCSPPPALRNVHPITFPREKADLHNFYISIIRSVKHHCGRLPPDPQPSLLDHLLHGIRLRPLPAPPLVL